jgi:hypothetical protein
MTRITAVGRNSRTRLLATLACVVALFAGLAACQAIAGVASRDVDPIPTTCIVPSLPSTGSGPQIRFVDLVPNADVIDVCVRASGTDWGRPVVRDGGTSCAAQLSKDSNKNPGFVYGDVTTPFVSPSAKIDVKMIAAGGTCSAAALTEGDGLTLDATAVNTILRIGGASGVPETIIALPEASMASPSSTNLRFVHAMPGLGPIDLGSTSSTSLPTTLSGAPLVTPAVAYGTTVGPSSMALTVLESNGYITLPSATINLAGAVAPGTGKAVFLQTVGNTNFNYSLYAIGVAGDNTHPQQSLLCKEEVSPTPPAAGSALTLLETSGKAGSGADCVYGPLPSISVDVFNPALYGPNAPYEDQRRPVNTPAIPNAINASGADFLCLLEVDRPEDQQAIISATQATYPSSYTITTTESTPFTNPKDQNGQVPAAATVPPCGGSVPSSDVDAVFSCVEQYCSTKPNDPTGVLQSTTDCLSENCAGPILAVEADSVACYDCLIDGMASDEEWGSIESACETNPAASIGFNGENASMILSKYPLTNTDSFILPATNYRRAVLYAQVQLEDQSVDFYCGFFITTLIASDLPFLGPYGGPADAGLSSADEYGNEQDYEAQQLTQWVQMKSAGRPAIIMGDWHSSVAAPMGTPDAGVPQPQALNPMAMTIMGSATGFTAASAADFPLQCTYCPSSLNPYNGQNSDFINQPFLYNWPNASTAVKDESVLFTDNTAIQGLPNGATGPLSSYYGLNITVIRPQ